MEQQMNLFGLNPKEHQSVKTWPYLAFTLTDRAQTNLNNYPTKPRTHEWRMH